MGFSEIDRQLRLLLFLFVCLSQCVCVRVCGYHFTSVYPIGLIVIGYQRIAYLGISEDSIDVVV